MNWLDIEDIAIALSEAHADVDPTTVHFVWLRNAVMQLHGFTGDANGCNERILEAIQQMWIEELD